MPRGKNVPESQRTGEFAVYTPAAFTLDSQESKTSEFTGSIQAAFTISYPDSETTNTTWSTPASFNLASPDPELHWPEASGDYVMVLCPTFQCIIPEIEILDSEDEEIQSALLESMQHQEPSTISDDSTEPSVADILQEFWDRYIKDDRTNCVISCSKPLDIAILLLEKTTVKLQNKLFVKFSGEIGWDHGGPRREFFRLASKVQNVLKDQMEQRFSDMIFNLWNLEKITDVQKRNQFLAKFGDWLADRGINPYRMAVADKGSMKEMVIKYHVLYSYRISSEIAQFKDGMDDVCGMLGMVTKHASVFQPLFCNRSKPLTKQEMDIIIRYDFSELGSNARIS
ncbi:hypothetical protein DPMN_068983 [Dreissena polymorpha]|uniref:HECT domain-containing protein n=1 Tax=Dreissena polymorpha TaxID=45954 RepID=A0A9D4BU01_DREPO|nr:hypothetical protein DPMN_068983 [Dreissena polymorpha]